MDVDSVLLSVQERDKWRHRLELLKAALTETRQKRTKLVARLRRIKRELSKLAEYSDVLIREHTRLSPGLSVHATRNPHITTR